MEKINGKTILIVIIWFLIIVLLFYTRFINLNWGLPYPMHPDERNMANAVQSLNCNIKYQISNIKNCFNPHFFAYGQLPLYLGYLLTWVFKGYRNFGSLVITLEEAVISLRMISAIASIINVFVLMKIVNLISKKNQSHYMILILNFSPFFIQFSHFGTTESLLMLFYSLIIYFSMRLIARRTTYEVVWLALVSGLAVATKVSSILFIIVPLTAILSSLRSWDRYKNLFKFGLLAGTFMIIFSPHNFINFQDFVGAMRYE